MVERDPMYSLFCNVSQLLYAGECTKRLEMEIGRKECSCCYKFHERKYDDLDLREEGLWRLCYHEIIIPDSKEMWLRLSRVFHLLNISVDSSWGDYVYQLDKLPWTTVHRLYSDYLTNDLDYYPID